MYVAKKLVISIEVGCIFCDLVIHRIQTSIHIPILSTEFGDSSVSNPFLCVVDTISWCTRWRIKIIKQILVLLLFNSYVADISVSSVFIERLWVMISLRRQLSPMIHIVVSVETYVYCYQNNFKYRLVRC